MGFFNLWTKNGNGHSSTVNGNGHIDTTQTANIHGNPFFENTNAEKIFIEKEAPVVPKPEPVANNIDLLNRFLDQNHEEKGYEHALVNPDNSHLEQNIEALRNELERTIRKVKTFYIDFIREIDFHIESRGRSGMIDMVDELKMKREIAESHIKQVLKIETDTNNKTGDSQGIVISYTRGFRNGLAAISHHNILSRKF